MKKYWKSTLITVAVAGAAIYLYRSGRLDGFTEGLKARSGDVWDKARKVFRKKNALADQFV